MSNECTSSCSVPTIEQPNASCACSDHPVKPRRPTSVLRQFTRRTLFLVGACLACCAPLIAPYVFGLFVGTPLATLVIGEREVAVVLAMLSVIGALVVWWLRHQARAQAKSADFTPYYYSRS